MKWSSAAACLAVAAAVGSAAAQPPSPGPDRDLGGEVRGVFAARCAGCHGPGLAKPKGRFGYVLDLMGVARNPEMVVPGRPDESELWLLVSHGEMPPADSPHGPPTSAEKEVLREWIAAGAPDAVRPISEPGPGSESPADTSVAGRTTRWVGKFHLLVLHFPIALVVAAAVGELLSALRGERRPPAAVRFCLWLAAVAAVPTVALGWLHAAAGNGAGSPQLLTAHRWLGTAAGLWLVLTAACAEYDARREVRGRGGRLRLTAGVALTAIAAHLGGVLGHGRDFFDW